MDNNREVMALEEEVVKLKKLHEITLGVYREEQEWSHKLQQEIAQWTARVLELEAAAKLALQHCSFPVGAMKAKTALEAALAEQEKK